jgi:F0F1-type ATP synthase delta subunit
MNRSQINALVEAIVKYDEFSEKALDWIYSNFSRQELKLFMRLLSKEIRNNNVTISFAGDLNDANRKKIATMFPNKKISFKHDNASIIGGMCFEYGDFVLDCSISGTLKRIVTIIKERL